MTRVLNLVTKETSRFFTQQVEELERAGVDCDTVSVPGRYEPGRDTPSRSVTDYLRFYPTALMRSLGSYDLVHANSGLTGPAAVAQPRRPVVLSLWGTELVNRYGTVSRACARLCDAVIVMSARMARVLDRECYVLPHGVDMEKFAPADEREARAELGWAPDEKHVLFPYSERRVVKDYPRARRLVDAVDRRVDRPVTLRTVSGAPHDRMPTYMNAADALLLTSRWEGSPNAVKEALACTLPVVSTPVGDVPERLRGVDSSYVGSTDAELIDGLVAALRDGDAPGGRTAVEPVSLERFGERLGAVYAATRGDAGGSGTVAVKKYDPGRGEVYRVALAASGEEVMG